MLSRERPTFARRGFLSGLAALPMAAAVVVPAFSTAAAPASDMEALWLAYLHSRYAFNMAEAVLRAAFDQLPWWVKPGPAYLAPDGSHIGEISYSPAIQDLQPSPYGGYRLLRPSAASIAKDCEIGPLQAGRDKRLDELRDRVAAAAKERRRLNLPALEDAASDALDDQDTICDAIRDLKPDTAVIIAMQIMICISTNSDDTNIGENDELKVAALGLRGLLPLLTGEIAVSATDFISDPERTAMETRLWQGIAPAASA